MQPGEIVQVTEYGVNKLIRLVVADRGQTIEICNEKEYEAATLECRSQKGVVFHRQNEITKDTKVS